MSVPQNDRKIQYSPAAGTTVLPYDFKIYSANGLAVDRVRNGIINTLIFTTDYTVDGIGNDDGGNVTLVVSSLAGDEYTVYGVGEQRTAEYSQNGAFYASAVNADMDNAIQISQQLRRDVDSKIGLSINDEYADLTLPPVPDRANRYVAFDALGNIEMADVPDITGVSDAPFIIKTPDPQLPNAQPLNALATGIVKNTTGTGVLSIAVGGTDYYAPGSTDVAVADGGTGASTAAGARTNLGLGTIATQDSSAIAITGGTITGVTDISIADGGTGASDAASARTNLGLQIGADVQAYDPTLTSLAAFNTNGILTQIAPDSFIASTITGGSGISVANGNGSTGIPTISVNINGLTADATPDGTADYVMTYDASAAANKKVLLNNLPGGGGGGGAPVGASYLVQTADATLTNEFALSTLATGILKNTTTTGVPTIAIAGTDYYAPTGTDVAVADGGTGRSSHTAYAVICGGTSTTSAQQSIATVGTAGQVLTSNGAGALPTFQTLSAGSVSSLVNAITQASHGFSVGNVLKYTGSAYALAKSDSAANSQVVGIVASVIDANNFVIQSDGYISTLSGLTAGTTYFLSPSTAGALTATEPSTIGQISKPLFIATSTTAGYIYNMRGIAVSAAPASSAMTLITTATASTSASIIFTGLSSTYFRYDVMIEQLIPVTDDTNLLLLYSYDNGSTFDTGSSSYAWSGQKYDYTGAATAQSGYSVTQISLTGSGTGSGVSNSGGAWLSGCISIYNPSSSAQHKNISSLTYRKSSGTFPTSVNIFSNNFSTSPVNAIKLQMTSGNISTGIFKLYGITA